MAIRKTKKLSSDARQEPQDATWNVNAGSDDTDTPVTRRNGAAWRWRDTLIVLAVSVVAVALGLALVTELGLGVGFATSAAGIFFVAMMAFHTITRRVGGLGGRVGRLETRVGLIEDARSREPASATHVTESDEDVVFQPAVASTVHAGAALEIIDDEDTDIDAASELLIAADETDAADDLDLKPDPREDRPVLGTLAAAQREAKRELDGHPGPETASQRPAGLKMAHGNDGRAADAPLSRSPADLGARPINMPPSARIEPELGSSETMVDPRAAMAETPRPPRPVVVGAPAASNTGTRERGAAVPPPPPVVPGKSGTAPAPQLVGCAPDRVEGGSRPAANSGPRSPSPQGTATRPQSPRPAATAGTADDGGRTEIIMNAVRRGDVDLFLQPIFALPERKPAHFQVIVRLRTPSGGSLGAEEFEPVARARGLMPAIDQIMLARVVQILRKLSKGAKSHGFVCRLSDASVATPNFLSEFAAYLRNNPEVAPRLVLETSDDAIAAAGRAMAGSLSDLRSLGVRLAIAASAVDVLHARALGEKIGAKILRVSPQTLSARARGPAEAARLVAETRLIGIDMLVDGIDDEAVLADVSASGIALVQGDLFSEPRPLVADGEGGSTRAA